MRVALDPNRPQAFGRIAGQLSASQFAHALPSLRAIAADEARHDRRLARAAGAIDGEWFGLRPGVLCGLDSCDLLDWNKNRS
jgi:hypothetical protein